MPDPELWRVIRGVVVGTRQTLISDDISVLRGAWIGDQLNTTVEESSLILMFKCYEPLHVTAFLLLLERTAKMRWKAKRR